MTRKLVAGLGAVVFASLSAMTALAACPAHTAQTSAPVQTADISAPSGSGTVEESRSD